MKTRKADSKNKELPTKDTKMTKSKSKSQTFLSFSYISWAGNSFQTASKFLLLIVFLFLSGSCMKVNSENGIAVKITYSNYQTHNTKTSNNISRISRNNSIVKVDEKLYLGYWSSGNGNVVHIKPTTIQTRNSYKELKYKDVTDDVAVKKGVYLLEILDLDKSNELQKYVTFKILPDDEMEGKDYDSYNDFVNDNESGRHARWVKDECKIALRFMK